MIIGAVIQNIVMTNAPKPIALANKTNAKSTPTAGLAGIVAKAPAVTSAGTARATRTPAVAGAVEEAEAVM